MLVRAPEEAQVVDLESVGATLVVGLKQEVLSPDLAELELLRVTGERRTVGVEGKGSVRTLVVVHPICLPRENHRSAPLHVTLVERSGDLVVVLQEAVPEVHGAHIRALREIRRRPRIHISVHGREHSTDGAVAAAEVLCRAHDTKVRPRLVRRVTRTRCALGRGVQHADR